MEFDLPVLSDDEATEPEAIPDATVLFAGDSGDGMQLTGNQFTRATAHARNDLATLPDYPAEIRAPAGTTFGVSAFQIQFGAGEVRTPGEEVDMLVAMNPAALKVHGDRVTPGGTILTDENAFTDRNLNKAGYDENPLDDGSLSEYQVFPIELTRLTRTALEEYPLKQDQKDRARNMFALGLASWLYSRPLAPAIEWIRKKFEEKPDILEANLHVLKKGYHFGETADLFTTRYEVREADLPDGTYRTITGAEALSMGLVAAGEKSGLDVYYSSYPITPASDILHEMSNHKQFGVRTVQAEDEIAAVTSALGASFGGHIGVTATSGPGVALKTEAIGLGVITELPLIVINMQRGGPSTGLPTKPEQSDLLQALYGRNGDAPAAVLAPHSPSDCFEVAFEAARIATKYMTPVFILADGYLGQGSEPWRVPDPSDLPEIDVTFAGETNGIDGEGRDTFNPYVRDEETLARGWATPGTPNLEHQIGGLEKEHETGHVSYDPENHQKMTEIRAEKIQRITQDIPETTINGARAGDVLVIGWGSTKGAIDTAANRLQAEGEAVSSVHLRYLSPLPADLGEIVAGFDQVLVPELNNGQLVRVLRDRFARPFQGLNKIQGQPFEAREIVEKVRTLLRA
ncbi:2-oxoglutarate ferredoxin oxidoreductase subunit alpha [Salinibacter sp. 10B]|uniref:2-oxoacid:acceptor oxidoreductase subunit alpha n=1 Tax=Salinibacter sp. 10B TaxID=1923971 RepID=UPI000CF37E85|nr:2-oxoacid:acceptor oxidoreductase subunit alpha [Salinibacter sp. 10B]PQJ33311.1 2-oxoglutarate ferredoxin oxidoreductase subunit alpha [Salinibacter sp. 10B]